MFDDIDRLWPKMTPEERRAFGVDITKYKQEEEKLTAQVDFMTFVKRIWPDFVMSRHHKIMAEKFEEIAEGKCKRLIINIAPRHGKSVFGSYLLPAWYIGKFPKRKIIQASHTGDLSVSFGGMVRNLIDKPEFKEIFPDVSLRADSKAAGKWSTNKDGSYFAVGVGGAVAGYGGDLIIIDDPISEQDGKSLNADAFDASWEWYMSGPRQRLQPNGCILLIMTRWSKRDLTGKLLDYAARNPGSDQWEVIEFPAIMPSGNALWPEFWSLESLLQTKATIYPRFWAAQYMQSPTSAESAIIKPEWWKIWEKEDPPKVEYVIQSWDTAFTKTERNDFSACTTWGVFYVEAEKKKGIYIEGEYKPGKETEGGWMLPNVILLDSFKEKMEFPELKDIAFKHFKEQNPDTLIVEAKASGLPLIQELRQRGIPVQEFTPSKGNDKIARVNAIADLFSSGVVWCPDTRWARELIDEVADFPNGDHDDLVDSMSCALIRYRQGGFIRLPSDDWEEPKPRPKRGYY